MVERDDPIWPSLARSFSHLVAAAFSVPITQLWRLPCSVCRASLLDSENPFTIDR